VRALNAQDSSSPWGYADTTHLTGKNGTPGTPQSLLASDDVVWAIDITGRFLTDPVILHTPNYSAPPRTIRQIPNC
jgi:hypothetical protein